MLRVRTDCEVIYAWIGGIAGLFAGTLLIGELVEPLTTRDGWAAALLTAAFAFVFVTYVFVLFYRQPLGRFAGSILLPSLVLGAGVYAIATLFTSDLAQPALLFLIGALVGQMLGRFLCAACRDGTDREHRNLPSSKELLALVAAFERRMPTGSHGDRAADR